MANERKEVRGRVPQNVYNLLKNAANRKGLSLTAMLNVALYEWFERNVNREMETSILEDRAAYEQNRN